MLRPPDGGSRLELASFVTPDHVPGSPMAMANELGLRNVSFEVGDLQPAVDAVAADGYGLVGGIGEYQDSAHGVRARAGGDHRVTVRADRLTRVSPPRVRRHADSCSGGGLGRGRGSRAVLREGGRPRMIYADRG